MFKIFVKEETDKREVVKLIELIIVVFILFVGVTLYGSYIFAVNNSKRVLIVTDLNFYNSNLKWNQKKINKYLKSNKWYPQWHTEDITDDNFKKNIISNIPTIVKDGEFSAVVFSPVCASVINDTLLMNPDIFYHHFKPKTVFLSPIDTSNADFNVKIDTTSLFEEDFLKIPSDKKVAVVYSSSSFFYKKFSGEGGFEKLKDRDKIIEIDMNKLSFDEPKDNSDKYNIYNLFNQGCEYLLLLDIDNPNEFVKKIEKSKLKFKFIMPNEYKSVVKSNLKSKFLTPSYIDVFKCLFKDNKIFMPAEKVGKTVSIKFNISNKYKKIGK